MTDRDCEGNKDILILNQNKQAVIKMWNRRADKPDSLSESNYF